MTGSKPQNPKLAATRRSAWRHPAVFWTIAVLLVVLLVRLVASRGDQPQLDAVQKAPSSSAAGSQEKWPKSAEVAVTTATPQSIIPEVEAPGRNFIAKLNLQPRRINGQVKGFVVRPEDPTMLKGTPLQSGDVLLEVDGLELDPARAASLAQNVGDYQDVYVRFERGSSEKDGILPLGSR